MNQKIVAIGVVIVLIVAGVAIFLVVDGKDKGNERPLLDNALEVYGNANNDWTINDEDVSLIESIIADGNWDRSKYPYADANRDGKVDQKDVDQVKALANNTAETVWIVDGVGTIMSVKCQPQRIYAFQIQNAELCAVMGYGDKIVAAGPPIEYYEPFLFPNNKNDVEYFSGDYERMSELDLDLYLVFSDTQIDTPKANLPDTDVVYLGLYYPEIADMESSAFAQGILKAGYIFGTKDRAEGYLNFLLDLRDTIADRTSSLAEDDKVKVLVSQYSTYYLSNPDNHEVVAYLKPDTISQAVALAGGYNVASTLPVYETGGYSVRNEVEWLDTIDIDWVTIHFQRYAWTGIDYSSPEGGYTATNPAGMYEAIDEIATRPLLDVDKDHLIMLPQEFRNGSTGGIMAAAYFAEAFYPELFSDFDADSYMEEYVKVWLGVDNYNYSEHEAAIIGYGARGN